MNKVIFVTGGARSGKSRYALSLAEKYRGKRAFIATAEPSDDEMKERIGLHRKERGRRFVTYEEPVDPGRTVESLPSDVEVAVVDCLTVWIGNLMYYGKEFVDDSCPEIARFLALPGNAACDLVIVSNELGMGIVPDNEAARRYRDLCGRLNQSVAERSDSVILMVSGIPLTLKGGGE
jgi:adenosylcobinamide kinase/adenosylcobinamide-phosphate guanylyltransferase